jgi:hypothetical protein
MMGTTRDAYSAQPSLLTQKQLPNALTTSGSPGSLLTQSVAMEDGEVTHGSSAGKLFQTIIVRLFHAVDLLHGPRRRTEYVSYAIVYVWRS